MRSCRPRRQNQVSQVQVHLLAQTSLRSNAKAIADDQHPDHQFRGDGGKAGVTEKGREGLAQLAQIHEAVNAAQRTITGYVVLEVERVEQRRLPGAPASHHVATDPVELIVAQL